MRPSSGSKATATLRDVEFEPKSNSPGVSNTVDTDSRVGPTPGGGVDPSHRPEPQITEDGHVLVYESEDRPR